GNDDVFCALGLDFHVLAVIGQGLDNVAYIIRLGRRIRNDLIQLEVISGDFILEVGVFNRCLVAVIGRKVSDQVVNPVQRLFIAGCGVVAVASIGHVG